MGSLNVDSDLLFTLHNLMIDASKTEFSPISTPSSLRTVRTAETYEAIVAGRDLSISSATKVPIYHPMIPATYLIE